MKTGIITKKAKATAVAPVGKSKKVAPAAAPEFPRAGTFTNDWGKTFDVVEFAPKRSLGYGKIKLVLSNLDFCKKALAAHEAKKGSADE